MADRNVAGHFRGFHFHPHTGRTVRRDLRTHRGYRAACGHEMSVPYALSALLTAGLFAYLLYALLKPEKF